MSHDPPRPSFFTLCLAEPFRLFFPFGVLAGISGVSLWPLFFAGLHKFYPGVMHARLMIEGFMGAFVIGFLGTAGPRLTGTPHFSRSEMWTLFTVLAATVGLHIGHQHFIGDLAFLSLLLLFAGRMAWRFSRRNDLPPPSFALVAFGFCNAIAGTALLIAGPMGDGFPRCALLGSMLLYQGFVLYLVLGIGGFLLPRFLLLPAKPEMPETLELSPQWKHRALFAAAIGAVLLAGFIIEVFAESPRLGGSVRFLAAAAFLAAEIPAHLAAARRVTITRSLRLALVLLLLGLLVPVLWPWQRVAGLHLVFIGGFTLITFTVATRVVLGHSGSGHLFAQPLPVLRTAAALLLIAATFRIIGDFVPASRGTLLDVASYAWMLAAAVWSWRILPRVASPNPNRIEQVLETGEERDILRIHAQLDNLERDAATDGRFLLGHPDRPKAAFADLLQQPARTNPLARFLRLEPGKLRLGLRAGRLRLARSGRFVLQKPAGLLVRPQQFLPLRPQGRIVSARLGQKCLPILRRSIQGFVKQALRAVVGARVHGIGKVMLIT